MSIAEALAALAGHGAPQDRAAHHSGGGDAAILAHLHRLARHYVFVKRFASTHLEHARLHTLRAHQQQQSRAAGKRREKEQLQVQQDSAASATSHLVPLCQTMLAVLREYEQLVLDTQHRLIYADPALVATRAIHKETSSDSRTLNFVSLATLRSVFEVWERPLQALQAFVNDLIRGPAEGSARPGAAEDADSASEAEKVSASVPASQGQESALSPHKLIASPHWTGGQLIDMLVLRCNASVGPLQRIMQALLNSVETSFMRRLQVWLCRGDADMGRTAFGQRNVSSDPDRLVEMAVDQHPETKNEVDEGSRQQAHAGGPYAGNPALAGIAQHLPQGLSKTATKQHSLTFLERRWRFRRGALPSRVTEDTAQDMLTVGRVLNAVRASSRTTAFTSLGARATSTRGAQGEFDAAILSPEMYQAHTTLLQQRDIRPSHELEFAEAMRQIREDVCEWLWQNVLTIQTVTSALQALGDYSLQRNGSFALAFHNEVNTTRRAKLLSAKSAAGAALQIADLDMAFHRASLGSDAEDDPALERFHFTMPQRKGKRSTTAFFGPAGDLTHSRLGAGASAERSMWSQSRMLDTQDEPARFDDLLLGVPVQLHYTAAWPLDLFLSPMDLAAYSRLFSFLAAMRKTQGRVLECWMALSQSQRMRRRFTGTGEGGINAQEENARKALLRKGWGLTRKMSWFLDTTLGHFQTDIIEVQYTRLLAQLQSTQVHDEEGDPGDDARTVLAGRPRSRHGSSSHRPAPSSRRRVSSTPSRNQARPAANELGPPWPQDDIASLTGAKSSSDLPMAPTIVRSPGSDLPASESSSRLPSRANSRRRAPAANASTTSGTTVVRRSSALSLGSDVTTSGPRSGLAPPATRVNSVTGPSRASTVIVGGTAARLRGATSVGVGAGGLLFPSSPSVGSKGGVLSAVGTGARPSLQVGSAVGGSMTAMDALQGKHLDFNSLQATHSAFLAFVQDGLLLSSPAASWLLRSILELCDQFVGVVERWGGDIVPDLLSEGSLDRSISAGARSDAANKMAFRQQVVQQVETELDDLLADFFRLLSGAGANDARAADGSKSSTEAGDASRADATIARANQSMGSLSLLGSQVPLARADQSLLRGRTQQQLGARSGEASQAQQRMDEARLEADVAARRHLEQLLLRLDFNRHFTDKIGADSEQQHTLGLPKSGSGLLPAPSPQP